MSTSLPVNATALFLSLTLVDDSGKKYRLNISSPNTGFSLSLQAEEDTTESVVDLASSDGEIDGEIDGETAPTNLDGGTQDDPLTVDSSSDSSDDSFEAPVDEFSGDEPCEQEPSVEEAAVEEAAVEEAAESENKDDFDEELDEIVEPLPVRPVRLQTIPRPPLNTVNGFGVRRSARTRTRARTVHNDESDSDESFNEIAGFSQEIFPVKKKDKSKK